MTALAITGATGYVGAAIAARACEDGRDVLALGRRPTTDLDWRPYELDQRPDSDLFNGVEVVVHCAYDLSLTRHRDIWRVNVEGTRRLVQASAAAGARFVLISSMSAYPGTKQIYGQAKLAAERAVLDSGGSVVRLGLVYGNEGRGMIGALQRLVGLPLTPLIGRNARQFTIYANDMVRGVLRLALGTECGHDPIGLAHPRAVRFEDLLVALARRAGTRLRAFDVPWPAAYGAMRLAEALRVPLPLRADSVLGLVRPAPFVPRADHWAHLDVRIRSFEEWARELPVLPGSHLRPDQGKFP
jgi:nucleoside-diphosphate-sugar epimerase